MPSDEEGGPDAIEVLRSLPTIVKARDLNWVVAGSASLFVGSLLVALGLIPSIAESFDPVLMAAGLTLASVGAAVLWRAPQIMIDSYHAVVVIRGVLRERRVPIEDLTQIAVQRGNLPLGLTLVPDNYFDVVLCFQGGIEFTADSGLLESAAGATALRLAAPTGVPVIRR